MTAGLVGLGLMGRAIAKRLMGAGIAVRGYDVSAAASAEAEGLGVALCGSASAAAGPVVLMSLPSSVERREALFGRGGLAAALRAGDVVLDTTTGRPEDTEEDAARLLESGVRLVDVCLSGSSQVTAEGRALALIGDREESSAAYGDVVKAISARQFYFGAPGSGNRVKLIVNCVFGLHRLVLAEALGMARAGGFDAAAVLDVLRAGETHSVAMETKGPKMIGGVYEPAVARLAQHAKDVDLIVEFAERIGAAAPLSKLHRALIGEAVAAGYGELDNAAIFKIFEGGEAR